MAKTIGIDVRCENCKTWFRSPIFMGGDEVFALSTLEGNRAQCPKCGKLTGCNKANMRAVFEDGTFRGDETGD